MIGFFAPLVPGFIVTPIDVVKTRMMVDPKLSHLGMYGVYRAILEEKGVKGLFQGLSTRMALVGIAGALFFPTYEVCRETILGLAK